MNISTKYCPGFYQDLRPFNCGCCGPSQPPCQPSCCIPYNSPNCGCNFDGNNILFFAIGYLIAKNNH